MEQLNGNLTQPLRTPIPVSADSDGVVLALETARALEARGDMSEAVKWLRRAAREAESQGNDARVLELAHVGADMASAIPQPPLSPVPPPVRHSEPSDSSELTIRETGFTPESLQVRSDEPPVTQHGVVPAPSPSTSLVCSFSVALDQAATSEATMRIGAVRVAIHRTTSTSKRFSVEKLAPGQSPPSGTIEAMLIIPVDVDGTRESTLEPVGKPANRTK